MTHDILKQMEKSILERQRVIDMTKQQLVDQLLKYHEAYRVMDKALELYQQFDVRYETFTGISLGEKQKTDTGFFNPAKEARAQAEQILKGEK